jgi:signal transduction histidine kinase/CheY-like chemotaxis protein
VNLQPIANGPGMPPRRPRLLVVDDTPLNVHELYRVFEADHQVLMATSGENALALCASQPPDLVLLDVVMPGMDGHEVCRRLKADVATRDIPVIFVTAQDEDAAEVRGLTLGAVDFISKPINPIIVRARVKTHLMLKAQSDLLLRGEREQRRLAGTLGAVLDALPAHIALLDERGVITAVNAAWRRFASANAMLSPACGVGQSYPGLCDAVEGAAAADAGRAAQGIRSVLRGQLPEASLEYSCHSQTEQRWFRMQVTPLHGSTATGAAGAADGTGGAVVMHIDIGDRKRTELAALLEQSDALILVLDSRGRIETANPAFISATGLSLLDEAPRARAQWQAPLPLRTTIRVRAEQARRDGGSFMAEWSVSPIFGQDGRLTSHVCIGRDITREQQVEAGLRENDKLRAVATFAGGIAHDFNNLLGSILGLTELCEIDAAAGSTLARNLGRIGQAGAKAGMLVRQMLDFSRQMPMAAQVTPASGLLAHAQGLLRAALPGNVTLTVSIIEDGLVNVDLVQMEQVLLNVTGNATHAMRQRGGEISIVVDRADPASAQPDSGAPRHLRLRVIDSGAGIAPEVLTKIFEPFFTTKPVGEGTGLGLAAVHGIVSNHGGVIEVASVVGAGTTFSVLLPLADPGVAL